jgi:hypothetical protein
MTLTTVGGVTASRWARERGNVSYIAKCANCGNDKLYSEDSFEKGLAHQALISSIEGEARAVWERLGRI